MKINLFHQYCTCYFSDDLKGLSKVWILGDNFLAESYRKNFKKASGDFFLKNQFEVLPFCSSKYSDSNTNTLSRIVNSFTQAMNTKYYLPDFLIVFLDNDLVEFLQYKKYNVATLLGPWIEFLAQIIAESLQDRFHQLSPKARPKNITQVYWVEAIGHTNFEYLDQQVREIFTQCLEATCKVHESMSMHVLKLREFWNKSDDALVVNNRFTKVGTAAYWRSLDASFKFNLKKRDDFLVRSKYRALKNKPDISSHKIISVPEDRANFDEMQSFFGRHRNNRFHWSKTRQHGSPRFMLPRLKKHSY